MRNGVGKAACRRRARVDLPELEAPLRRMTRPSSDVFGISLEANYRQLVESCLYCITNANKQIT